MKQPHHRILGVLGIGITWGLVWAAVFSILVTIIRMIDPTQIDAGEGPADVSVIGFKIGFVSGALFGVCLSLAENRRLLRAIPLTRALGWGALASAALPLLTPMNNSIALNSCPLGAITALATVAMARRSERPDTGGVPVLRSLARVVAAPLHAACASNLSGHGGVAASTPLPRA